MFKKAYIKQIKELNRYETNQILSVIYVWYLIKIPYQIKFVPISRDL